jgi:transposase
VRFPRRLELLKMWVATPVLYSWKTLSTMKTKVKANESESSSKAAAEIAKLKVEIERLKTDRQILKKALGLLTSSN